MRSGRAVLAMLVLLTPVVTAGESLQSLTAVADRPPVPDYRLPDVDGKFHRLSDLRGKVVLINFWATWCPPCRRELPSMQRLADAMAGESFEMHAIDIGEDETEILPFVFSTGIELKYPILLDRDSAVLRSWPVVALPTSFVIDPEGRIVFRAVGGREWDDPGLIRQIRSVLPATAR